MFIYKREGQWIRTSLEQKKVSSLVRCPGCNVCRQRGVWDSPMCPVYHLFIKLFRVVLNKGYMYKH